VSLFDLPEPYVPHEQVGKPHWHRHRSPRLSCDVCTLDRHHHRVSHPVEDARWRVDDGRKVFYVCETHALQMWSVA